MRQNSPQKLEKPSIKDTYMCFYCTVIIVRTESIFHVVNMQSKIDYALVR